MSDTIESLRQEFVELMKEMDDLKLKELIHIRFESTQGEEPYYNLEGVDDLDDDELKKKLLSWGKRFASLIDTEWSHGKGGYGNIDIDIDNDCYHYQIFPDGNPTIGGQYRIYN